MSRLRLIRDGEGTEGHSAISNRSVSEPERELRAFVHSMVGLIGPGATKFLTELWLDEVACMDCIAERQSANWRSVSAAASVTLASRVIASQLSNRYW
jgi:hypothetical protein